MHLSPLVAIAAPPVKPGPRGCTNLLLHQLVRRMDRLYDAELTKAGLKTIQYSLLSHVVRLAPVSPGVLAQAMKMQPSTLTRNLRPLVLAGWIDIGDGRDARSRGVMATSAGVPGICKGNATGRWCNNVSTICSATTTWWRCTGNSRM